jgi:hypothetical protein
MRYLGVYQAVLNTQTEVFLPGKGEWTNHWSLNSIAELHIQTYLTFVSIIKHVPHRRKEQALFVPLEAKLCRRQLITHGACDKMDTVSSSSIDCISNQFTKLSVELVPGFRQISH